MKCLTCKTDNINEPREEARYCPICYDDLLKQKETGKADKDNVLYKEEK